MTGYARGEADYAADRFRREARPASLAPKDYSVPLHVDCSIEYELPDCAKPPQGVKIEPLLMIHPAHFRRLESLRRVPFVNNLPRAEPAAGRSARGPRRRAPPAPAAPPPCSRLEPYAPEGAVSAAKLCARARLKAHPYVPLECDAGVYERFDKRALQQLPIYM